MHFKYHVKLIFLVRCIDRTLLSHVLNNEDVTGFYLWGPRGCGKTTGIGRALEKLKKTPVLFKGTATAEGLFESAKDSSDGILWFNDDPRLMKDAAAQQYLLAMLEGSVNPKTGETRRIVTKARAKSTGSKQFEFTGKIIFDSNTPLGGSPSRSSRRVSAAGSCSRWPTPSAWPTRSR